MGKNFIQQNRTHLVDLSDELWVWAIECVIGIHCKKKKNQEVRSQIHAGAPPLDCCCCFCCSCFLLLFISSPRTIPMHHGSISLTPETRDLKISLLFQLWRSGSLFYKTETIQREQNVLLAASLVWQLPPGGIHIHSYFNPYTSNHSNKCYLLGHEATFNMVHVECLNMNVI